MKILELKKIINRFKNPHLSDDVTRVGREPIRKLSQNDRLIKPMLTATGYGYPADAIITGIGAALRYDAADDEQAVRLQDMIDKNGVINTFKEISGVEDTAILNAVKEAYDRA